MSEIDYRKMYLRLFNALTDAIEAVQQQNYGKVKSVLMAAQQQAEEIFLEQTEDEEYDGTEKDTE